MLSNAMVPPSDSPNSGERLYTLTPLGFEACAWIEEQERLTQTIDWGDLPVIHQDDEFLFSCRTCGRSLSLCQCENP